MSRPPAAARVRGVDAARGVALLGMAAVHVLPPTTPDGSVSDVYLTVAGRAAALFAVLAGVGLTLVTGRTEPPRGSRWAVAAASLPGRAAVVGGVGLVLGGVDSGVAVILCYYALLFLLAMPMLALRPPAAALLAVTAAVTVPVTSHALRPLLPPASLANPTLAALEHPLRLLSELGVTGYYPALAWVAYLAAGLAVGRLDLTSPRVAAALAGGGAALAAGSAGLSWVLLHPLGGLAHLLAAPPYAGTDAVVLQTALDHGLYGTTPTTTWWWLAVDAPHTTTPLDLLHTIGTSVLVLGVALLVLDHGPRLVGRALQPLAAAGSMTLTLYALHVLALGLDLGPVDPQRLWVTHAVVALALATGWRHWAGRGPLERLAHVAAAATAAPVRAVVAGRDKGGSAGRTRDDQPHSTARSDTRRPVRTTPRR